MMDATSRRIEGMVAVRSATVRMMILLLLLAFALPACGGSGSKGLAGGGDVSSERALEEVTPDAQSSGAGGNLPSSASGGALASGAAESQALPEDFDRKIVKSAELGLRAEDVRRDAARAREVATRFGGSVLSSRINGGDGSVYTADLVLSVPSQEFEGALEALRGLGSRVTTDTVSGEDVTEEFVDLESRERNLVAAEQSLLRLYDRADSVGDALSIERELTNIRGQIEQVQGRIQYLEQRTTTSQITLNIQPVAPPPPPAWSPVTIASHAWDASLAVLQTLATVIISAVVFGWWLVPVLIAGFVWWRRRNRGSGPATDSEP